MRLSTSIGWLIALLLVHPAPAQEEDEDGETVMISGCVTRSATACLILRDEESGETYDIGSAKPAPQVGAGITALGYPCYDCVPHCSEVRAFHVTRYVHSSDALCQAKPDSAR